MCVAFMCSCDVGHIYAGVCKLFRLLRVVMYVTLRVCCDVSRGVGAGVVCVILIRQQLARPHRAPTSYSYTRAHRHSHTTYTAKRARPHTRSHHHSHPHTRSHRAPTPTQHVHTVRSHHLHRQPRPHTRPHVRTPTPRAYVQPLTPTRSQKLRQHL